MPMYDDDWWAEALLGTTCGIACGIILMFSHHWWKLAAAPFALFGCGFLNHIRRRNW